MTMEIKLTDHLSIFHWGRSRNEVVCKFGWRVLHAGSMVSCKHFARKILSVKGRVLGHLGLLLR